MGTSGCYVLWGQGEFVFFQLRAWFLFCCENARKNKLATGAASSPSTHRSERPMRHRDVRNRTGFQRVRKSTLWKCGSTGLSWASFQLNAHPPTPPDRNANHTAFTRATRYIVVVKWDLILTPVQCCGKEGREGRIQGLLSIFLSCYSGIVF